MLTVTASVFFILLCLFLWHKCCKRQDPQVEMTASKASVGARGVQTSAAPEKQASVAFKSTLSGNAPSQVNCGPIFSCYNSPSNPKHSRPHTVRELSDRETTVTRWSTKRVPRKLDKGKRRNRNGNSNSHSTATRQSKVAKSTIGGEKSNLRVSSKVTKSKVVSSKSRPGGSGSGQSKKHKSSISSKASSHS